MSAPSPHLQALREMTDGLAAEAERDYLQASLSHLACCTENVGMWAWYIDEDRVLVNDAFCSQYGVDASKLPTTTPVHYWIAFIDESDRGDVARKLSESLENDRPYQACYTVCRPDGVRVTLRAKGRVRDKSPSRPRGVFVGITTTERLDQTCNYTGKCEYRVSSIK